jgi:transcription elongation factor Elf1
MAEAVSFWLDNKMSSGIKVAEAGSQTLVSYRDKFYVVEKGSALMKGSKPLHYSKSSIPTIWRKVMAGKTVHDSAFNPPDDDNMPIATATKKERVKVKKTEEPIPLEVVSIQPEVELVINPESASKPKIVKSTKKPEAKPAGQPTVVTACPYCSHKHDVLLDKGKNGKAFLMSCSRCSKEFAVRFMPVTVYQAQVAAFS